ncbi:MAG: CueP family metal-binding protein [Armatimonadota bacterium]|nr:CueP family metal-binding protein [Armatimonadota bacterium]
MPRILPVVLAAVLGLAAAAVPAPAGDFYVALAPYLTTTHPCTYHVKGSCQGELAGATFRYWLRSTDGTVSRSGVVRAGDDGFVELWVPPHKRYVITFAYQGRRGTGTFSSFPRDPTCITTIRLR